MRQYFINYPRGFANEYTVFVTETPEDAGRLQRLLPHARRITRRDAEYFGYYRPNRARGVDAWAGGFAYAGGLVTNVEDAIREAAIDTREYLDELERERAAAAEVWE